MSEHRRCLCGQMIHESRTECIECEKEGFVCPNCGVDKIGFIKDIKKLQARIKELEDALRFSCECCQNDNGHAAYSLDGSMNCHVCKIGEALKKEEGK